ncbi:MAG TPA: acyltransferase [Arachidicoccus sp.]
MDNYKNITFFKGLNALRFFAAFLVVMHHAETIRRKNGLANFEWFSFFRNGTNAVNFFFVLSGFLITYLLLKENRQTGTVSIKKFYVKRILRIWPLYFLLVIAGALVIPALIRLLHIDYEMPYTFGQVWIYFVSFLPGLVTYYFGHHLLEPLWSIGVEEVFYLIWAPVFKFCKRKILPVLLSVIVVKAVLILLGLSVIKNDLFNYIVNTFNFEAMAVGGLGAYFIYNRQRSLAGLWIYKTPVQIVIYLLLAVFLLFNINIGNTVWKAVFGLPVISGMLIDFLFLYLIIGVSLIDHNLIRLKSKVLSYLGEISYGIYMFHMILVFMIILFLKKQLLPLSLTAGTLVFYAIITPAVILVASLSRFYFEKFFLDLKGKSLKNKTSN